VTTEVDVLYGDLNWTPRVGTRIDCQEAYLPVLVIQRSVCESHVGRWQLHRYDETMCGYSLGKLSMRAAL
jgi:hypothetical protein